MKRWLRHMDIVAASLLMCVAFACAFLFLPRVQVVASTPPTPQASLHKVLKGEPASLKIPTLSLNLSVQKGRYDAESQSWSLNDTNVFVDASYSEGVISDDSNAPLAFLYGHATGPVLGKMSQLKPGDAVTIDTDNDYRFTYVFTQSIIVNPKDTWVLENRDFGELAIMACSGLLSEKRTVAYFSLEGVEQL